MAPIWAAKMSVHGDAATGLVMTRSSRDGGSAVRDRRKFTRQSQRPGEGWNPSRASITSPKPPDGSGHSGSVALVIIVAFGVAAPRMRHDDPSRPPATCEDPRTGLEYDC